MMAEWLAVVTAAESPAWFDALKTWAKAETGWQLALVGFGVIAQGLFLCRWIVQWIATERRGESHVPVGFWWLSLAGATLLFVYFVLRGEPVGVIGQSIGWTVYSRNLYLIHKRRRHLELDAVDPPVES
jgi:lipid-A-disaccharide synthase-like uncharacterized protein